MNKFKHLGWFVSTGDQKKNRCVAHKVAERQPPRPRHPVKISAVDILFGPPETHVNGNGAAKPDYTPRPKAEHPLKDPGTHGPHTIKTKVVSQLGIDDDLDKIHRRITAMRKITEQHLKELDAILVTVQDAQKRVGIYRPERVAS